MSTQELISAAMTLADEFDNHVGRRTPIAEQLREACARAMVQPSAPDMAEVERLVHEFDRAAYRSGHAAASRAEPRGIDLQRTALLDYARGVLAERDQFRDAAKMVPDFPDTARAALLWVLWHHQGGSSPVGQPIRFALGIGQHEHLSDAQVADAKRWGELHGIGSAAPQPVGEVAADLIARQQSLGPEVTRILADNMDALIEASNPVVAAEVPMPDAVGLRFDGTSLHKEIDVRTYGDAREAAGYAAGLAAVRDYAVMRWKAEVALRPLENKHRRTLDDVWRQVIANTGGDPVALIGPCHDALVALRGEVKK